MIPDLSKIREMAEQFRASGRYLVLPVETVLALLDHIEATDKLLALRTADLAGVAEERDAAVMQVMHAAEIARTAELLRDEAEEARDSLTAKLAEARRVIESAVNEFENFGPSRDDNPHWSDSARQWLQGDGT